MKKKRILIRVLGCYVFLWILTATVGRMQIYHSRDSRVALLEAKWGGIVVQDYNPNSSEDVPRPDQWCFRSKGWSPCPFIVVSRYAESGRKESWSFIDADVWFLGIINNIWRGGFVRSGLPDNGKRLIDHAKGVWSIKTNAPPSEKKAEE